MSIEAVTVRGHRFTVSDAAGVSVADTARWFAEQEQAGVTWVPVFTAGRQTGAFRLSEVARVELRVRWWRRVWRRVTRPAPEPAPVSVAVPEDAGWLDEALANTRSYALETATVRAPDGLEIVGATTRIGDNDGA